MFPLSDPRQTVPGSAGVADSHGMTILWMMQRTDDSHEALGGDWHEKNHRKITGYHWKSYRKMVINPLW